MKVTFLTRKGCHLCDEARRDLDRHLAGLGERGAEIVVEEVDIETDDELHRRYLERIPVIEIEGATVSEFVFDPVTFDTRLETRPGHPG